MQQGALAAWPNALDLIERVLDHLSGPLGAVGADGKKVEVRDVPAAKVLSYTWQGDDTKANVAKAKTAIKAALTERKLSSKQFRLLGYNGPATPRDKATWELQAVLDEAD